MRRSTRMSPAIRDGAGSAAVTLPALSGGRVGREPLDRTGRGLPGIPQLVDADHRFLLAAHVIRLRCAVRPLAVAREVAGQVPVRAKRRSQLLARGRAIALAAKSPEGRAVLPERRRLVGKLTEQRARLVISSREQERIEECVSDALVVAGVEA